ncbi:MAG: hypothetical protein ACRDLY_15310 [Thermoleophilaceae bacterium]
MTTTTSEMLVIKAGMPERARELYEDLRGRVAAEYDSGDRSASATAARTRSARPSA